MTDTELDLETQAHQLVARGREVLIERMRTAYSDAAAAQADLITLDDEHIEAMVQSAADRADGLQWRRALAAVAAEELGISPTEALSHPAVTRAQSLVGAPSYEQSLAEMIARPVPPTAPAALAAPAEPLAAPAEPAAAPAEASAVQVEHVQYADEPSDELETVEADDVVLELLPEPDPGEYEPEYEAEAAGYGEPQPLEPATYPTEPATYPTEPAAYPTEPEPTRYAAEPEEAAAYAAEPEPLEPDPEPVEPEPRPIDHETQAYDVEASFTEEPLPPAPTNPFAAQDEPGFEATPEVEAPPEIDAPEEQSEPIASEPTAPDDFQPPTEEHHSAGVAAAIAAVSVPGSVPDPVAPDPHAAAHQHIAEPEPEAAAPEEENVEVSFPAVHLGGVAGLPTKKEGLSVRLSGDGLDIMHGPREIVGRLLWDEIEALEVPDLRVRRRQKTARARLVVRTPHGDASFEVPEVTADELRDRVEPLMRLYGRH